MTKNKQLELGYDVAEGLHAERKNRLGLALMRVGADLHLRTFVEMVFNLTHGGSEGQELIKSYRELAATPWGLCCSLNKVRTTVAWARRSRLVDVREMRYVSFGQRANAYRIDWNGVSAALDLRRRPGALTEHPPALTEHPFKEHTLFSGSSLSGSSLLPAPAPEKGPPEQGQEPEPVPRELIEQVPELREAAATVCEPLPVGALARGPWAVLTEKHLSVTGTMLDWYRRQLSLPDPVLPGGNEAELLLILASGLRAARLPAAEVRQSRVGVFVGIVSKRAWRRVLRYVTEASQRLAEHRQSEPEHVSVQ